MEKSVAPRRPFPLSFTLPFSISPSTALRWLGLLIFPILLAMGVDFGEVFDAIRDASPGFTIASLAVLQVTFVVRAWRWQIFCRAAGIEGTGFWSLYWIQYAGLFAGATLPQGAAPFTQVIFLAEAGHSWRRGLLSIFADRIWEGLFVLLFAAIAAVYLFPEFPELATSVLAVVVAMLAGGLLTLRFREPLRSFAERHVERLLALVQRFAGRFDPSSLAEIWPRLRSELPSLISSATLVAVGQLIAVVLLAKALGIDLSPVYVAMAASFIGLMMMLPITINGLGAREGILVVFFHAGGATREEAIALGLLMFATSLVSRLPGFLAWTRRPKSAVLRPESSDAA